MIDTREILTWSKSEAASQFSLFLADNTQRLAEAQREATGRPGGGIKVERRPTASSLITHKIMGGAIGGLIGLIAELAVTSRRALDVNKHPNIGCLLTVVGFAPMVTMFQHHESTAPCSVRV